MKTLSGRTELRRARAADACVMLYCPLADKIATLRRKIYYSRWN